MATDGYYSVVMCVSYE